MMCGVTVHMWIFCFSSIAAPVESDEFEVAEKIKKKCKWPSEFNS